MSFKHFFRSYLTENEVKTNFEQINEGRWWGKFKEDTTTVLEYTDDVGKLKRFKVCKMDEDGSGPAYVLEARGGARYGLFRATEGNFHVIRMKSGKKHLIKPKGIFKEVEGKLVFELFTLKHAPHQKAPVKVGGGKDLIKTAVANKKKAFDPNATLLPKGGDPRIRTKEPASPEKPFDPNATIRERRANIEPDKSFPNGEVTYDKNTDEWNKGIYTDAKA